MWLTLIVTLLTFFASKKNGASTTRAAITAGLAGAGTYFVTHETDWGRENLGAFDGVEGDLGSESGETAVRPDVAGTQVKPAPSGFWDTLRSWGATGTATVIGTGAAAGGALTGNNTLLWIGLAVAAVAILN